MRHQDFWDMSLIEWQYLTEGYVESLKAQTSTVTPMTQAELAELEEECSAWQAQQS